MLIYLTHENFLKEQAILKDFKSGRVDGVLISVSSTTKEKSHICDLILSGVPVVFFDRAIDEAETARVTTDDFESGYNATTLLLQKECKRITYLSLSDSLSAINKRMSGFKKALSDNHVYSAKENNVLFCGNK